MICCLSHRKPMSFSVDEPKALPKLCRRWLLGSMLKTCCDVVVCSGCCEVCESCDPVQKGEREGDICAQLRSMIEPQCPDARTKLRVRRSGQKVSHPCTDVETGLELHARGLVAQPIAACEPVDGRLCSRKRALVVLVVGRSHRLPFWECCVAHTLVRLLCNLSDGVIHSVVPLHASRYVLTMSRIS